MSTKLKVRLAALSVFLAGAFFMFLILAGQDAEAPALEFARIIDPVVYVDDNDMPCSVPPPSRNCRSARKAGR